jgi:tRNA-binding EMAP/Myf-like protein
MIVIVNVWLTTEKTTIHALLSKDREFFSTILNIYFLSYVVQRLLNLILNLKKKNGISN